MRTLEQEQLVPVTGDMQAPAGDPALSGIPAGAAWGVAELGLGGITVPVQAAALDGFLEVGAALTDIVAVAAALAG